MPRTRWSQKSRVLSARYWGQRPPAIQRGSSRKTAGALGGGPLGACSAVRPDRHEVRAGTGLGPLTGRDAYHGGAVYDRNFCLGRLSHQRSQGGAREARRGATAAPRHAFRRSYISLSEYHGVSCEISPRALYTTVLTERSWNSVAMTAPSRRPLCRGTCGQQVFLASTTCNVRVGASLNRSLTGISVDQIMIVCMENGESR